MLRAVLRRHEVSLVDHLGVDGPHEAEFGDNGLPLLDNALADLKEEEEFF